LIIVNNCFVGGVSQPLLTHGLLANYVLGAVNSRDNNLNITDYGDHLVFDGFKNFNTDCVVSDLTVLEGVYSGTEHRIFAVEPTAQPGVQFAVSFSQLTLNNTHTPLLAQLEQHWSPSR
jgi:hypothetical protein